jgi:hypothetical protein
MNPAHPQHDLLTRYLLGYVSEAEREAVWTRVFSDAAFAEALEDAENDLFDAYVRGELSPADTGAVQTRLLNSEQQQEKLALAKALAARRRVREPNPKRWMLAAASIILLVGAAGIWLRTLPLRKQASAPPRQESPRPVTRPKAAEASPAFAALLAPGVLRGAEVQEVTLPQNVPSVRLDLDLNGAPVTGLYSVELIARGDVILQQQGLIPRAEGDTTLLSVAVQATLLGRGPYTFRVNAPGQQRLTFHFVVR